MSLIPVDAEYHYVQDTAPTSANAGDVWLDTSNNPPIAKIYADVGDGLEWLQDQTTSRIDIPVSDAGASATDITNAVWDDDQQHGPSDLRAGVDWASKTPKIDYGFGPNDPSVSGSGYLLKSLHLTESNNATIEVTIDGTTLISHNAEEIAVQTTGTDPASYLAKFSMTNGPLRFDSSFSLSTDSGQSDFTLAVYVLD